jgi:hypothetical protein
MRRNGIAKSLENILDNPIVAASLDRSQRIYGVINQVILHWSVDLSKRHPAPAFIGSEDENPDYLGTDLDLFSFLMSLSQRRAVINIPDYENLRKSLLASNQTVITNENRHGQLLWIESNAETHAFSTEMMDYNVLEIRKGKEIVGAPRKFAVVDDFGELYDGWTRYEWHSSEQEDKFIEENDLERIQGVLEFNYFIHPNRAFSFYGSPYIATKILAMRIKDQASFYRKRAKQLKAEGVKLMFPGEEKEPVTYEYEGETIPQTIQTLEAKLIIPDFHGEYPIIGMEIHNRKREFTIFDKMPDNPREKASILRYSKWVSRKLSYRYGPLVRAAARAVELAFFKYGLNSSKGSEIRPGWQVPDWNRNFREGPRTRIDWNQLILNDYVHLLYRTRETTAQIRVR